MEMRPREFLRDLMRKCKKDGRNDRRGDRKHALSECDSKRYLSHDNWRIIGIAITGDGSSWLITIAGRSSSDRTDAAGFL